MAKEKSSESLFSSVFPMAGLVEQEALCAKLDRIRCLESQWLVKEKLETHWQFLFKIYNKVNQKKSHINVIHYPYYIFLQFKGLVVS